MFARLEDLDTRRVGGRTVGASGEFPGSGESTDAPADYDDGRSAHLGGRLADDVREDGREHRVVVERRGAHEIQSDLASDTLGFDVEVEEHFQVVGDESNRTRHDVGEAVLALLAKSVENVRAEPGVRGAAGRLPRDVKGW